MKKSPKWSKLRKHIHQQGGRSDGLYNAPKRSPLSDTPQMFLPPYFQTGVVS
ncbi:hypothetical protein [Escherichia coli]|uniref:hypothetical protein n=1 Tax=Escherichia coli TaxID=562 RepID=UPI001869F260|nr:hypothetical protein [Escherichia coli]